MSKFSRVRFRLFVAWNVHIVFFLFLCSGYFCTFDACVVCIVSGHCNHSSPTLFYVVFLSYWWRKGLASIQVSWMLTRPFPVTYSLTTSYLEYKALCIVMSFLGLWSICWSSSLVHFKNGPESLTRWTAQVFMLLMRFLLWSFISRSFLVLLWYLIFFFYRPLFDGIRFEYSQVFVSFFFSKHSDFSLILVVLFLSPFVVFRFHF